MNNREYMVKVLQAVETDEFKKWLEKQVEVGRGRFIFYGNVSAPYVDEDGDCGFNAHYELSFCGCCPNEEESIFVDFRDVEKFIKNIEVM